MKKLLLASVAVGGLAFAATPAHAEIELEVGGYFKGYAAFVDQDDDFADVNGFDFIRDTEIHIGGETTLDNGLTIGTHFEFDVDGGESADVDESYLYFSGDWGRVNFGAEDGAAYLLQVAAPSADSNIDGIRQYVQPINWAAAGIVPFSDGLDYDHDPTGKADKLTYLSPVFSGFQAGLSFSPDTDAADDLEGIGTDDVAGDIGQTYEIAVRYEGQFNNIGMILGGGYSHGDLEEDSGGDDDRQVWNLGADFDIGPFGIGVIYTEDNNALDDTDSETLVIGTDYTTGPFKIGASYLNLDTEDVTEVDRYTGGVTYEYGPGMSFRGSISYTEVDPTGGDEVEGTAIVLGTQVNF